MPNVFFTNPDGLNFLIFWLKITLKIASDMTLTTRTPMKSIHLLGYSHFLYEMVHKPIAIIILPLALAGILILGVLTAIPANNHAFARHHHHDNSSTSHTSSQESNNTGNAAAASQESNNTGNTQAGSSSCC